MTTPTGAAPASGTAPPPARGGGRTRVHVTISPLARTELRLHLRHGVVAAVAVLTAVWVGLLVALPVGWRTAVVPWVLFLDLATLGFFFVPALLVVERTNGVTAALALTRLTPARALGVRTGLMALWSCAAALAVTAAAGRWWAPQVLAGAVLTSVLFSLLAVVLLGRHDSLTGYLPRVPAVCIPLLVPALLHGTGLWSSAVLHLSPATGALQLLAGRWSWLAAAWVLVWIVGLWVVALEVGSDVARRGAAGTPTRRRRRPRSAAARPGASRAADPPASTRRRSPARSFARADVRTLQGDTLLKLLLLGVPLLGLAVRLAGGPGVAWVHSRYGVDLTPHLPALWAFVVVLHTPTMFGALCGLLFLEDRDAHLLPAITTTRASLGALLRYRLGATALSSAAAVVVALVIADARHDAGAAGVAATAVVAAAVSTVPAMTMAALVRDRIAGMAVMKAIGLPLYLPLAWWFVDAPAGWLFALVPTGWAVRTFWASSVPAASAFAAGGVALSLAIVALLTPRLYRSVGR